jgi:hypothetical protein
MKYMRVFCHCFCTPAKFAHAGQQDTLHMRHQKSPSHTLPDKSDSKHLQNSTVHGAYKKTNHGRKHCKQKCVECMQFPATAYLIRNKRRTVDRMSMLEFPAYQRGEPPDMQRNAIRLYSNGFGSNNTTPQAKFNHDYTNIIGTLENKF